MVSGDPGKCSHRAVLPVEVDDDAVAELHNGALCGIATTACARRAGSQ